jgi:hypothetical protein
MPQLKQMAGKFFIPELVNNSSTKSATKGPVSRYCGAEKHWNQTIYIFDLIIDTGEGDGSLSPPLHCKAGKDSHSSTQS